MPAGADPRSTNDHRCGALALTRRCPEWGRDAPGVAPVLAISATDVVRVLVGHGVMRRIAGPAREDPLARPPSRPA
jgi:hypothetical protein